MSSRQEEKERRRKEREAAEAAVRKSSDRKRRLQLVAGAALALVVIAAVAIAVAAGGGGDGGGDKAGPGDGGAEVALPPKQSDDLQDAAKAAGCTVKEFPDEGNTHLTSSTAKFDEYKTNPPTSGTHRPEAAADGIYDPGNSPDKENWVHTLEHGRVILQYAPGTDARRIGQLTTLMNEEFNDQPSSYKTVLMENNTKMPFAVAAISWRNSITCKELNDRSFDALRAFRSENVDKSPEADFPWPARCNATPGPQLRGVAPCCH